MYNMNRCCKRLIVVLIVVLIVDETWIFEGVSYQWAIYQKYDWRGHASPCEYGLLATRHRAENFSDMRHRHFLKLTGDMAMSWQQRHAT